MTDLPVPRTAPRFYSNKDMQRIFGVSRATIDRWCRENPHFPKKVNLIGSWHSGRGSTRFVITEVEAYLKSIRESVGVYDAA